LSKSNNIAGRMERRSLRQRIKYTEAELWPNILRSQGIERPTSTLFGITELVCSAHLVADAENRFERREQECAQHAGQLADRP
jgi:hypothetical protein